MIPRSIRCSTPSVSASRQVAGFSRSSPRSIAKWLRVPALITRNGRSCSAAIPATSACVPSPPATPSRSAPSATALRARAATSTWPGPSSSATSAPSASAFSLSPNFATFPPPDLGFMIRNARWGGGTSRAGIPGSAATGVSASRPAAMASATSTSDATPTQMTWFRAKTTSTAIGTRITTPNASHRTSPRRARNQYPFASTRHAPTAPMATMPRLASPAKAIMTAAAARISANAARASQRRCVIASPHLRHRKFMLSFPRRFPVPGHPPRVNPPTQGTFAGQPLPAGQPAWSWAAWM